MVSELLGFNFESTGVLIIRRLEMEGKRKLWPAVCSKWMRGGVCNIDNCQEKHSLFVGTETIGPKPCLMHLANPFESCEDGHKCQKEHPWIRDPKGFLLGCSWDFVRLYLRSIMPTDGAVNLVMQYAYPGGLWETHENEWMGEKYRGNWTLQSRFWLGAKFEHAICPDWERGTCFNDTDCVGQHPVPPEAVPSIRSNRQRGLYCRGIMSKGGTHHVLFCHTIAATQGVKESLNSERT